MGSDSQSCPVDTEDWSSFLSNSKARRCSSAERPRVEDSLDLANQSSFKRTMLRCDDRLLLFSDTVIKINRRGRMQERVLAVTDAAVYNLSHGGKVNRRIPINSISHISMSNLSDNFFVIHVSMEYDYLFYAARKTEAIAAIRRAYTRATDSLLSIRTAANISYNTGSSVSNDLVFTLLEGGVSTELRIGRTAVTLFTSGEAGHPTTVKPQVR